MESTGNKPFGVDKAVNEEDVRWILERVLI